MYRRLLFLIICISQYDSIASIVPIITIIYIKSITLLIKSVKGMEMNEESKSEKTSIQISASTRDRLYRLKFRRTYDQFLNELCDLYENEGSDEGEFAP